MNKQEGNHIITKEMFETLIEMIDQQTKSTESTDKLLAVTVLINVNMNDSKSMECLKHICDNHIVSVNKKLLPHSDFGSEFMEVIHELKREQILDISL